MERLDGEERIDGTIGTMELTRFCGKGDPASLAIFSD
jgi:hypothetical protein